LFENPRTAPRIPWHRFKAQRGQARSSTWLQLATRKTGRDAGSNCCCVSGPMADLFGGL
jgi:hypothetical protein